MATAIVEYSGNLRTHSTHVKSGVNIITDAPTDNHGKGEAFSPTDLLCSSLASCMLTIMGISANSHGVAFNSAVVKCPSSVKGLLALTSLTLCVNLSLSDKPKHKR